MKRLKENTIFIQTPINPGGLICLGGFYKQVKVHQFDEEPEPCLYVAAQISAYPAVNERKFSLGGGGGATRSVQCRLKIVLGSGHLTHVTHMIHWIKGFGRIR